MSLTGLAAMVYVLRGGSTEQPLMRGGAPAPKLAGHAAQIEYLTCTRVDGLIMPLPAATLEFDLDLRVQRCRLGSYRQHE